MARSSFQAGVTGCWASPGGALTHGESRGLRLRPGQQGGPSAVDGLVVQVRRGDRPAPYTLSRSSAGMRKLRIASGSCRRARLEVGSKVMSWSRNWPRKVNPAVIVGLLGLLTLLAGSVIRVTGSDGSSPGSMGPPAAPSSASGQRIGLVASADDGGVGTRRPNGPWS